VSLVVNARTDVYLRGIGEPGERFEHAVRRANAYRAAGADCLFVPGVRDAETIGRLARAINGPLNVLAGPGMPPVAELGRLGVVRVSVGSGPMTATLTLVRRIAQELKGTGTYSAFTEGAVPYAEWNRLMGERGA
jgi:2-methylisocitrate lyase-like PEP mutase family enzyme